MFPKEKGKIMAELEAVIEKRLIDQLCSGESQWTYRPDIRTEEQLWNNFKYILEQNNKAKLNDTPLSDSEFAKVKNDLSHASFYDAGKWLVGENGKVYVHVQRGNETLHLLVMNNEHIAGGTSVYEVINQYQAFATGEENDNRDRRFDVTLLINGIPMIHIELKNKEHSYMDAYRQIKKYIAEGKFHGIFSNVQMFVVSNAIDTKYFSAARDTELNKKFITGWIDKENLPVCDYIDFAKAVLKIPEAHEMVTKYTVLDNDKKKLLILRPYQIHAIEAMRAASRRGKSGFIWHTTGSGKTMTSYKATRNLLMDIPSIEKTIFLIDRKDLDLQTKMAFQSYADNDTIDVDDTDYVDTLIKKLTDGNRQMIVTTRQKMQTMVNKRLQEGTKEYEKIKNLKVAFVVDECHRAVTPERQRHLEKFFTNSLWYGFTGTPIFSENKREQKGDLAQTTEEQYGACLHEYTVKEAIHDRAVLGFNVEYQTTMPDWAEDEIDEEFYDDERHMLAVLDAILNRSKRKLGFKNGVGNTYEAILTVKSIARAQAYYALIKKVKNGETSLKISESVKKVLPDFPKVAITYSVTENDADSVSNQAYMEDSLQDYNAMFGTHFNLATLSSYNSDLNDRLARKKERFAFREEQLDLVIVVDRLLTGFDAPCLSTLFMDRQPMKPQHIIQAFSRTNRLFDEGKKFGQIVTFQTPDRFKEKVDEALSLYSNGGESSVLAPEWPEEKAKFLEKTQELLAISPTPEQVPDLDTATDAELKRFAKAFQEFDKLFSSIQVYADYDEKSILQEIGLSLEEIENFVGQYQNVIEELRRRREENPEGEETPFDIEYELESIHTDEINYHYILSLIQTLIENKEHLIGRKERDLVDNYIEDLNKSNPKLSGMISQLWQEVQTDTEQYQGQSVAHKLDEMIEKTTQQKIHETADYWKIGRDELQFVVDNFRIGREKQNGEKAVTDSQNYAAYKEALGDQALPKLKYKKALKEDYMTMIAEDILPLRGR